MSAPKADDVFRMNGAPLSALRNLRTREPPLCSLRPLLLCQRHYRGWHPNGAYGGRFAGRPITLRALRDLRPARAAWRHAVRTVQGSGAARAACAERAFGAYPTPCLPPEFHVACRAERSARAARAGLPRRYLADPRRVGDLRHAHRVRLGRVPDRIPRNGRLRERFQRSARNAGDGNACGCAK